MSDTDSGLRDAQERMGSTIEVLRRHGLTVRGELGDADPLAAIAGALVQFPANEIMIST